MFNKPIKPANDIEGLKRSAFWHLARRDHSEHELRLKLARKTDNQQWIDSVINECYEFNYLNDNRFCGSFIRNAQNKGHGINRIQRDLQLKGINNAISEPHFSNDKFNYIDSATEQLQRRYHQRIENALLKQKAMVFLQSRGHTFEHIFEAIENHNCHFPLEEYDAVAEALSLLQKKFYLKIEDKKQQDKAKRFLISKGYSFNDCNVCN
ncbi:regulatory protein RecX [Psychromonas sp. KJ10-10]|uniref:regulatory protein RecX n=1 Tax=Psychromonas sp. KJ10-10 TaxID=3391823 RepID=UPI0039B38EC7